MNSYEPTTILVVDDDRHIRRFAVRELRRVHTVYEADGYLSALKVLAEHPEITVVISDYHMGPDGTGLDLLKRIWKLYPWVVRVLASATLETEAVEQAMEEGTVAYYLSKPWFCGELLATVSRALSKYSHATQTVVATA